MKTIWEKLNLKDQKKIMLLNAPESFGDAVELLDDVAWVSEEEADNDVQFFLFFVTTRTEIERITSEIVAHTSGDVVVWFSYPKGTSKKYTCDFNRDNGWEALFDIGFTGVRQVAIDQDWSALRFRRRDFVKSKGRG